jgi:saccharopine dehydrogenase-like NADP-dependent oxidoreductase
MKRSWPYEYKAPFSPIDILEEYTRPARLVERGEVVERPALSEPELVDIDPVGTLESFNTDGLRSLLKTMDVPNMKEKTLRYPGHIELMKIFRESGFFGKDKIDVKGNKIRPIDLTSQLLFPMWKLGDKEDEFTVMTIKVTGEKNGQTETHEYKLYDRYDPEMGISSMARTTGFTCTAAANLVLDGKYTQPGISPPEYVAAHEECFLDILDYLEERNVIYEKL